jgi:hypothetical protein
MTGGARLRQRACSREATKCLQLAGVSINILRLQRIRSRTIPDFTPGKIWETWLDDCSEVEPIRNQR